MLYDLNNVSLRYPDGVVGLVGVTVQIAIGSRIAIVGANGSGKSSLLRLMAGQHAATSGSVLFDGRPLVPWSLDRPSEGRRRIGLVSQDPQDVVPDSQLDPTASAKTDDCLFRLGIGHLADRAPLSLSGGEKRKVAVASVLAANPDTVLFDDPIAGLDPPSQDWLIRAINRLQESGATTVVATQSLEALPLIADRVLVLSEGHRLIASRPVEMLLEDIPLLRRAGLISDEVSVFEPEICLN